MDIGVVIVTYNRIDKLKTALKKFDEQTYLPRYVMVVNNASTDGTDIFLSVWKEENKNYKRIVINKDKNTGGSGGFHTGLKAALNESADWIWVSDDDAFPRKDALEQANKFLETKKRESKISEISAVCSLVVSNGVADKFQNRSIYTKGISIYEKFPTDEDLKSEFFEKSVLSYVGSIINKEKLKLAGLPNKDYFIYFDDTEHGMRLNNLGRIICLTHMVVDHDIPASEEGITWKTYYKYRNMISTYEKHFKGKCFWFFISKVRIKIFLNRLTGNKNKEINILEKAYQDVKSGNFGMDSVYKPGYKP